MVLLKNLLLLGAALVFAIPSRVPAFTERELTLETHEVLPRVSPTTESFEPKAIERRQRPSLLQWSPQGRVIFICSVTFPQAIIDSFADVGPGAPAKVLIENFRQYLINQGASGMTALNLFYLAAKRGGVYGKGGENIANSFGFGIQTANTPSPAALESLVNAIAAWANAVQILPRPNDFFDLARIGAGGAKRDVVMEERSRTDQCPAVDNILQYATLDVPGIDINADMRWAGLCPEN